MTEAVDSDGTVVGSLYARNKQNGGLERLWLKRSDVPEGVSPYDAVQVHVDETAVVHFLTRFHPESSDPNDASRLYCGTKAAWGTALRDWVNYLLTREVLTSKVLECIIQKVVDERIAAYEKAAASGSDNGKRKPAKRVPKSKPAAA